MSVIRYSLNNSLAKLWNGYSNPINTRTRSKKLPRNRCELWKDKFFTEIVKLILPTGSLTLIASLIIGFRAHNI